MNKLKQNLNRLRQKTLWSNRMRVSSLKDQDKLNDAGFAIKKQFAKSADALSDIARGTEVQGGTLAYKDTDSNDTSTASTRLRKRRFRTLFIRLRRTLEAGKRK
ncbi:hypothetical protein ABE210_13920 [Bacillus sonorensis]|uniref:hypothetical protein n=1 Tax=Bacillus sonorensis TaxID=119858 RepID=UPI003D1AF912